MLTCWALASGMPDRSVNSQAMKMYFVVFIFLQMEVGMRLSLSVMGVIDILLITNHWMFIRLRKVYEGHV